MGDARTAAHDHAITGFRRCALEAPPLTPTGLLLSIADAACWAAAAWAACGLALLAARTALDPASIAVLRLGVAPLAAFGATLLAWRRAEHLGPAGCGVVTVVTALALEAIASPVAGAGFALAAGPAGGWGAAALMFAGSFGAGRLLSPPPER
jgi:hypothetical protein